MVAMSTLRFSPATCADMCTDLAHRPEGLLRAELHEDPGASCTLARQLHRDTVRDRIYFALFDRRPLVRTVHRRLSHMEPLLRPLRTALRSLVPQLDWTQRAGAVDVPFGEDAACVLARRRNRFSSFILLTYARTPSYPERTAPSVLRSVLARRSTQPAREIGMAKLIRSWGLRASGLLALLFVAIVATGGVAHAQATCGNGTLEAGEQ